MRTSSVLIMIAFTILLVGCSQSRSTSLTPGAAKKHIKRGVTSQIEVAEMFGTPNIITQRDGGETWIYDKVSSKTTTAVLGGGGMGVGVGGSGGGGGLIGGGVGSTTRSETTVMLIIYFDENDVVKDYKMQQTKF